MPRQLAAVAGLITAVWLAVVTTPAWACLPNEDFVPPSNFELVGMADTIVIAEAVDGTTDMTDESGDWRVRFRVKRTLKGEAPPEIVLADTILGKPPQSDPYDFTHANEQAYEGACRRYIFARGKSYVLILARDGDRWRFAGGPFTRTSEDYDGDSSPWVRTVEIYVAIQKAHPGLEGIDALEQRLNADLALPRTPALDAMDRDFAFSLLSLGPDAPTAFLLDALARTEHGEPPRFWGSPPDTYFENAPSLKVVLGWLRTPRAISAKERDDRRLYLLRSLAVGRHPGAQAVFDALAAKDSLSGYELAFVIKFFANNGQPRRAYDLAERHLFRVLPLLDDETAAYLVRVLERAMSGDHYGDNAETWRTDAYLRAHWPETALMLHRLNLSSDTDAIATLLPSDYRARPEITLALSGREDVRRWAMTELADDKQRQAQEESDADITADPAELPMKVLVRGFGEDRDAALEKAFCDGGRRRLLLIGVLGDEGGGLDVPLLRRIAAATNLSADDREALATAAVKLLGRTKERFEMLDRDILASVLAGAPASLKQPYGDTLPPLVCKAA